MKAAEAAQASTLLFLAVWMFILWRRKNSGRIAKFASMFFAVRAISVGLLAMDDLEYAELLKWCSVAVTVVLAVFFVKETWRYESPLSIALSEKADALDEAERAKRLLAEERAILAEVALKSSSEKVRTLLAEVSSARK